MTKEYEKKISTKVEDYLVKNDWNYEFDEETGRFRFNLNLKGKLRHIQYVLDIHESDFMVYAICPIEADHENPDIMINMVKFLTMANYGLRSGNFEFDLRDGEIRYKVYVECEDMDLSDAAIENGIHIAAFMFERYSKGLTQILFNDMSAEDAIGLCEKENVLSELQEPEVCDESISELLDLLKDMKEHAE